MNIKTKQVQFFKTKTSFG